MPVFSKTQFQPLVSEIQLANIRKKKKKKHQMENKMKHNKQGEREGGQKRTYYFGKNQGSCYGWCLECKQKLLKAECRFDVPLRAL